MNDKNHSDNYVQNYIKDVKEACIDHLMNDLKEIDKFFKDKGYDFWKKEGFVRAGYDSFGSSDGNFEKDCRTSLEASLNLITTPNLLDPRVTYHPILAYFDNKQCSGKNRKKSTKGIEGFSVELNIIKNIGYSIVIEPFSASIPRMVLQRNSLNSVAAPLPEKDPAREELFDTIEKTCFSYNKSIKF